MYDDLLSAPRVIDIPPQGVNEFIESISSTTYELSHQQGGSLPYTVIREITENFIHAGFLECTVSILNEGNTLRFADQGPGILKKDLVLQPGVSSATSKMKDYIRGVGSGFPIVREYLSSSHGYMDIEDNAEDGVIVTISLVLDSLPATKKSHSYYSSSSPEEIDETTRLREPAESPFLEKEARDTSYQYNKRSSSHSSQEGFSLTTTPQKDFVSVKLNMREEQALLLLSEQGMLGPVDLAGYLNTSAPTATRLLQRLELLGMVESTQLKKRILSNAGMAYVQELLNSGYSR